MGDYDNYDWEAYYRAHHPSIRNLLKETVEDVGEYAVRWVGNNAAWTTWDQFRDVANFEYNGHYEVIRYDLVIVGDDWFLQRDGADWSPCWEFCDATARRDPATIPTRPATQRPFTLRDIVSDYYFQPGYGLEQRRYGVIGAE